MISAQQFLMCQPSAPEETPTDKYYLDLANRLVAVAVEKTLFPSYPRKGGGAYGVGGYRILSRRHLRCRDMAYVCE